MQTFKDSVTGKIWEFKDDVKFTKSNGVYSFKTSDGTKLTNVSKNLQPYTKPTLTPDEKLQEAKNEKISELKNSFKNAQATGHCTLSLGWDIDCRRGNGEDDVSNMDGLISIAKKKGLADTDQIDTNGIKGYDNQWHPATVADVRDTIIPEMCEYGLSLYQKKFQLESQVNAITLASGSDGTSEITQVNAITWG